MQQMISEQWDSGAKLKNSKPISKKVEWTSNMERNFLVNSLVQKYDMSASFGTVFAMFANDHTGLMNFDKFVQMSLTLGLIPLEVSSERKDVLEFLQKQYSLHVRIRHKREPFNRSLYNEFDGLGLTEVAHCLDLLRQKRSISSPTLMTIFRELAVAHGPSAIGFHSHQSLNSVHLNDGPSLLESENLPQPASHSKVNHLNSIINKLNTASLISTIRSSTSFTRPHSASSSVSRPHTSATLLQNQVKLSSPSVLPYPLAVSPVSPTLKSRSNNAVDFMVKPGGPGFKVLPPTPRVVTPSMLCNRNYHHSSSSIRSPIVSSLHLSGAPVELDLVHTAGHISTSCIQGDSDTKTSSIKKVDSNHSRWPREADVHFNSISPFKIIGNGTQQDADVKHFTGGAIWSFWAGSNQWKVNAEPSEDLENNCIGDETYKVLKREVLSVDASSKNQDGPTSMMTASNSQLKKSTRAAILATSSKHHPRDATSNFRAHSQQPVSDPVGLSNEILTKLKGCPSPSMQLQGQILYEQCLIKNSNQDILHRPKHNFSIPAKKTNSRLHEKDLLTDKKRPLSIGCSSSQPISPPPVRPMSGRALPPSTAVMKPAEAVQGCLFIENIRNRSEDYIDIRSEQLEISKHEPSTHSVKSIFGFDDLGRMDLSGIDVNMEGFESLGSQGWKLTSTNALAPKKKNNFTTFGGDFPHIHGSNMTSNKSPPPHSFLIQRPSSAALSSVSHSQSRPISPLNENLNRNTTTSIAGQHHLHDLSTLTKGSSFIDWALHSERSLPSDRPTTSVNQQIGISPNVVIVSNNLKEDLSSGGKQNLMHEVFPQPQPYFNLEIHADGSTSPISRPLSGKGGSNT